MTEEKSKVVIEVNEIDFLEEKEKEASLRVLRFCLGKENYCLDINQAKEVTRVKLVTKVHNAPEFITGVINLRGEIIPLLDVKQFLGIPKAEITETSRVIVSDLKYGLFGILVDKIGEALDIPLLLIQPSSGSLKGVSTDFTEGVVNLGEDIVVFLNLEKILNCAEIRRLRKGEY